MNELVSVIVPVYNTKAYLEKCIESILQQTYQNLEIIIVDDGSTDGSIEICNCLQKRDGRINVIYKTHGGAVATRQAGIERAQGKYTITIDSDDWIEPPMIAELYKAAVQNEADIVTSGYYRDCGNTFGIVVDGAEEGIYDNKNREILYKNMMYGDGFDRIGIRGVMWCKLIRTTLLKEMHSKLSNVICNTEDHALVYSCCARAEKIVVTHKIYYHYVLRTGSTAQSYKPYYFSSINELYLFLKNEFEKSPYNIILKRQLDLYIVKWIFMGINHHFGLDKGVALPYYEFDKSAIKKNARIVLYSAGKVGNSFYKQIYADKSYQLIGWVDKNYLYYQQQGQNVFAVDMIKNMKFDYILLAFEFESLARSVKENLVEEYGVEADKIIWLKPVSIIDKYICFDD